jgi:hypothetical protein
MSGTSGGLEKLPQMGQNFPKFRGNQIAKWDRVDHENHDCSDREMQNQNSTKENENEKSTATRKHYPESDIMIRTISLPELRQGGGNLNRSNNFRNIRNVRAYFIHKPLRYFRIQTPAQ